MLIFIQQIFAFNHWRKLLQRSGTEWRILLQSYCANKSVPKCTIFSSETLYNLLYIILNYLHNAEKR